VLSVTRLVQIGRDFIVQVQMMIGGMGIDLLAKAIGGNSWNR